MKNKASLIIIFTVVFIDLIGFGILIPILPTIAVRDFNISETAIGFLVAIFSLVQFIFNPILGNLSDKYGRKPIILICLLLSSLSYIIFAFSNNFLMLFISRIISGLGGSSISVAQAYIADITTKENRSKGMGIIGAAFALGFVFGPLIGGILSKYGIAVIGFAGAGFSFIAFLITLLKLSESLRERQESSAVSFFNMTKYIKTLKRPAIGILIILFFIITFSMANIFGTFSLLGNKVYHLSDLQIGYLFGIMGFFSAVSQTGLINLLSKYIKEISIITIGAMLMLIALIFIPFSGGFEGLAVFSGVFTLGTGLLIPTSLSLISKFTPDNEQGAILGMNQSFAALARVLGPIWGGFSFQFLGYQYPFITGAIFTFIVVIYCIFYLSNKLDLDTL